MACGDHAESGARGAAGQDRRFCCSACRNRWHSAKRGLADLIGRALTEPGLMLRLDHISNPQKELTEC